MRCSLRLINNGLVTYKYGYKHVYLDTRTVLRAIPVSCALRHGTWYGSGPVRVPYRSALAQYEVRFGIILWLKCTSKGRWTPLIWTVPASVSYYLSYIPYSTVRSTVRSGQYAVRGCQYGTDCARGVSSLIYKYIKGKGTSGNYSSITWRRGCQPSVNKR